MFTAAFCKLIEDSALSLIDDGNVRRFNMWRLWIRLSRFTPRFLLDLATDLNQYQNYRP